jgi:TRAP-type C4-dicarboxylate transport system substrate-binding protein
MRRLRSKLGAGAIVAVGVTFGLSAAADTKIEWNHSTWGNPRAWTKGIETVAEYVKENSGGNFTIRIHYGETLSPSRQNLDGVSIGAFEQASMCTSYHPGKNPVGSVLDLPFLPLGEPDVQGAVYDDFNTGFEPWLEEMGRWNAVPYFTPLLPQYEFMGRGTPPNTLEDWRGMRVRALGGLGSAMRKLGAVPTTVPAPEVYTTLERGIVQAVSFPYAYAFGSYRAHEVSKWYTAGMKLGTPWCLAVANVDAYNELPDEYKRLLEEGKTPTYDAGRAGFDESLKHWEPIFDKHLERIEYTAEQHEELKRVAALPVWEEWVQEMEGKNIPGQEILDTVFKLAEETQPTM